VLESNAARRSGGSELENRKLTLVSLRHIWTRTGRPRHAQAQKFGAEMLIAKDAKAWLVTPAFTQCDRDDRAFLPERCHRFGCANTKTTTGNLRSSKVLVLYGATASGSAVVWREEVIVVGGGNSAGQAAVFLAQTTRQVYMLVRADGLAKTMSAT